MNTPPSTTDRTRVRRQPIRSVPDREVAYGIIDAALIAHVAVLDSGVPYVLPVGIARRGDAILFHGSTGSRLFRLLAAGQPTCLTVTHLDGLVMARSAFESSMNYRSVMALGTCTTVEGEDKLAALEVLTDHLTPGRWADLRPVKPKELAATLVLALPLEEISVKVRTGGPADDEPEDIAWPIWAGHIPIHTRMGSPIDAEDLPQGLERAATAAALGLAEGLLDT